MSNFYAIAVSAALLPFVGGFAPSSCFTAPQAYINLRGCSSELLETNKAGFSSCLAAKIGGGIGFGKGGGRDFASGSNTGANDEDRMPMDKTYAEKKEPIKDLIDSESAMSAFFDANEEWAPLFRSFASHSSVPALSFLGGQHGSDVEFDDQFPWQKLDPIPTGENDIAVLSLFLDAAQRSLVEIPVVEFDGNGYAADDENDLQFLEEGRRMLVITRFHVLSQITAGEIDHHEQLFRTCWSELLELQTAGEEDTGSLILVPDYDISDLRRFADMNLQRPLEWLGLSDLFEVTSLQRESPAIRIIHKLSDIPEGEREK